jgi:hypothetical protein
MLPKCYTEIEIKKEIEKDLKKNNNKKDNVEVEDFFESIWNLYPNKKGKNKVSTKSKKELSKLGFDTIKEVIERYKIAKPDWQHYQNGSTFFNGGYIDYLEQNYKEPESEYIPTSYYYKEC